MLLDLESLKSHWTWKIEINIGFRKVKLCWTSEINEQYWAEKM